MWIRSKCRVMTRDQDNISWESDSSRWHSKPFYPMIVATVCVCSSFWSLSAILLPHPPNSSSRRPPPHHTFHGSLTPLLNPITSDNLSWPCVDTDHGTSRTMDYPQPINLGLCKRVVWLLGNCPHQSLNSNSNIDLNPSAPDIHECSRK